MNKIKIPPFLSEMNALFKKAGFRAYLVGGAVRDMIMGKSPADFDVATDARPDEVMRIFRSVIPTGIAHGTVTVRFQRHEVEVTTFRAETTYSDGRHPDSVAFGTSLTDDLARRDFTMNAIAVSLGDGKIEDPFGGSRDIRAKIIRTVGSPLERFAEDGLRPIRAVRFSAQLSFKIEEQTLSALSDAAILNVVKKISMERFRDEFVKILAASKPSASLSLLETSGILALFIPELLECRGCVQKDIRARHEFDVLDHLFYACDGAPREKLRVRLAALFHDIGKPAARAVEETECGQIITFYNHENYSAKIVKTILERLKFPNALIADVCGLVQNHMFHYESAWTDAAVRRFLSRVGPEHVEDLFDVRLSDIYGMHNAPVRLHDSPAARLLLEFKDRIENVQADSIALNIKSLAVNGRDLMALGIPSGKELGALLNELLNTVIDDPAQNTKETLLKIAEQKWKTRTA